MGMARNKYKELAKEVAVRLRAAMREFDIATNPQMAALCAASANAVNNWLQYDNLPKFTSMSVFCERKGLTLDWIYRGKSPKMSWRLLRKLEERSELSHAQTVAERIIDIIAVLRIENRPQMAALCSDATAADVKAWVNSASQPNILHMIALCENTGLTLDWIYRGAAAEVDRQLLRRLDRRVATGDVKEPIKRAPRAKPGG